jgi:hypothetical protein
MFMTSGPTFKASADQKTATLTLTITSFGMLPAVPGDVSLVLFDPVGKNITFGFDAAALKCTLPPALGTWTTVKTRPAPVAPRKSLKLTFKGVALPMAPIPGAVQPFQGLVVIDSACKSSPSFAFGGFVLSIFIP